MAARSERWCCGLVSVAIVATALVGCSTGSKKPRSAAAVSLATVDPDSAINVDGGRVSVRSPVGWQREPRSSDCIVRYMPPRKTYPSVSVTASDPPAGIAEVTAENHAAFVAAVAEQLASTFTAGGKSTLLRKPAAVTLGSHLGVAWAAPGTAKVEGLKQPIERSSVAIVTAGRMYTVEARAPKGKLDDAGRAAARGVAAGIAGPATEEEATLAVDEPAAADPSADAASTPADDPPTE